MPVGCRGKSGGRGWLGAAAERAAGDVSFASAAEATRRDRAVVVAVVGAEGDDAHRSGGGSEMSARFNAVEP